MYWRPANRAKQSHQFDFQTAKQIQFPSLRRANGSRECGPDDRLLPNRQCSFSYQRAQPHRPAVRAWTQRGYVHYRWQSSHQDAF
jgi:hypothetical protein